MAKILTVGEIMLRFQPQGYKRFSQVEAFEAVFGGGEANVAVSLAGFGESVAFVSKLPDNAIADKCICDLRGLGVDVSSIVRGGSRLGVYYCEKGFSVRPSNVIYDRAGSSINEIDISEFDLNKLFDDVKWLHFTGITPALSSGVATFTDKLLAAAKERGVFVSCDLNYRKKLWSREEACKVMSKLCKYVDLLISNEEDAKDVFGITAESSDITSGKLSVEGYKGLAAKLMSKFSNLSYVAFTLRESFSANRNGWSGLLADKDNFYVSKKYDLNIIDRVGGGDSFGAGLIYSLINGKKPHEAIDFAVAASALKHTIEGDFNLVSAAEVKKLADGDGSGRVNR